MFATKIELAGRNDGDKAPLTPWSAARRQSFPDGLPRPLFTSNLEMRDAYFEKYFGLPAKRLEEIYLKRLERFKPVLKLMRRQGNENARQRMTVLLCGFGARRLIMETVSERDVPTLEAALIRRFAPDIEKASFDRERLREFRWFLMAEKNITRRALPNLQHYLMALPPAMEELSRWSELQPERRDDLVLALFALGSMMGERIVLDVAIKQCPEIQHYYETLEWEDDKRPGESTYRPPADKLSTMCLEGRADSLLDLMGRFIGFLNEMNESDLPRLPYWVARIRRLHEYINDHFVEILDEYRESNRRLADGLLAAAESEMAELAEFDEEFTAKDAVLSYLREMSNRADCADLETVDAMEQELRRFGATFDDVVEQAWKVCDRIEALEEEIAKLVDEGAMSNAARIGQITTELQAMRGSIQTLFQPLTAMKVPEVKPAPVVKENGPPSLSTGRTEEQMLIEELRTERDALLHTNRQLKEELSRKAGEAYRAQARQRETNGVASVSSGDAARRVAALCMESGRFTPAGVLRVIETVHGRERVVVLPSAYEAARKSEDFRQNQRLYKLLTLLVTDYRDALRRGRPDTEARHILGNAYRANESESVQGNRDMSRRRHFHYEGKEIPMFRHLGIGVGDSTQETLRVHFHWDAEKARMVIGYVGPHLDTITS